MHWKRRNLEEVYEETRDDFEYLSIHLQSISNSLLISDVLIYFLKKYNRQIIEERLEVLNSALRNIDSFLDPHPSGKYHFYFRINKDLFFELTQEKESEQERELYEVNFNNFEKEIQNLNKILETCNDKFNEENIKFRGFKIKQVIKQNQVFLDELKQFCKINDIKEKKIKVICAKEEEHYKVIEINNGTIIYDEGLIFSKLNLPQFFYLIKIKEVIFEGNQYLKQDESSISWMNFFEKITIPKPEFDMSGAPDLAEKTAKKIGDAPKTLAKKQEDDEIISSPIIRKEVKKQSKSKNIETDSSIFVDIPFILERLNTFEDAFIHVFNHYGINWLINDVILCLTKKSRELLSKLCRMLLDQMPRGMVDVLLQNLTPDIQNMIAEAVGDMTDTYMVKFYIREMTPEELLCALILALLPGLGYLIYLLATGQIERPTLSFPELPTISDILESILREIEHLLYELISSFVVLLLKDLLEDILEWCREDPSDIGKFNPKTPNQIQQVINDNNLLNNCNIDSATLKRIFNELLSFLSPNELCSLLNGSASYNTIRLFEEFIAERYPEYVDCITRDLLEDLGKFLDPEICNPKEEENISFSLCDEQNDLRRNLLSGRLSPSEIDEQLGKIEKRKEERFENLISMLNNEDKNIFSALSSSMEKIIPSEPEPLTYMNSVIVDSYYNVAQIFFEKKLEIIKEFLQESRESEVQFMDPGISQYYFPMLKSTLDPQPSYLEDGIQIKGFEFKNNNVVQANYYNASGTILNNEQYVQDISILEDANQKLSSIIGRSINISNEFRAVIAKDLYNLSFPIIKKLNVYDDNSIMNSMNFFSRKEEKNLKNIFNLKQIKEKIKEGKKKTNNFISKDERKENLKIDYSKPIIYLIIDYVFYNLYLKVFLIPEKEIIFDDEFYRLFNASCGALLGSNYALFIATSNKIAINLEMSLRDFLMWRLQEFQLENFELPIIFIDDQEYLLNNFVYGGFILQKYTNYDGFKFHEVEINAPFDLTPNAKHGLRLCYVVPQDNNQGVVNLQRKLSLFYNLPEIAKENLTLEVRGLKLYLIPIIEMEIESSLSQVSQGELEQLKIKLYETQEYGHFLQFIKFNEKIMLNYLYNSFKLIFSSFPKYVDNEKEMVTFLNMLLQQTEKLDNYKY